MFKINLTSHLILSSYIIHFNSDAIFQYLDQIYKHYFPIWRDVEIFDIKFWGQFWKNNQGSNILCRDGDTIVLKKLKKLGSICHA